MTKAKSDHWSMNKSISFGDVIKIAVLVFSIGIFYNQIDANQKKNEDKFSTTAELRKSDVESAKEDIKEMNGKIENTNQKIETLSGKVNDQTNELTAVKGEIKTQTTVMEDIRDLIRQKGVK